MPQDYPIYALAGMSKGFGSVAYMIVCTGHNRSFGSVEAKLKTGTVLATTFEQYVVESQIGSGGSGDVVLARDSLGAQVAIKALRPKQAKAKLNRFRNELAFCSTNEHKNIVRVLDRGLHQDKAGDQPFYVMPLYESTLRKEMQRLGTPTQKLQLFSKILDGVEAAHLHNIIHRDLKPENILMNPSSGEVVIADFGIAHFEEDNVLHTVETAAGDRLASWEYAAPEQRRPGQVVDYRADIYSLGLILVELFTGEVPHGADPQKITAVAADYSYLDDIATAMRQNAAERRPQSIGWVKNELIARHQDFVQTQKLDELRKTVIPASQVNDPLISNPPTLEHVEYRDGALHFTLSAVPNARWIHQFRNMLAHAAVVGSEPNHFMFKENRAIVPVQEPVVQMVINHFKNYLMTTNGQYSLAIRTEVASAEEQQRRDLQERTVRQQRQIETNERINSQLKW